MIAIFYGKDGFSAQEALAALKAELDTDGLLAESTERVAGRGARPEELLALFHTMPFLSAHRLIVVDGLLARFEVSGGRRGRRGRRRSEEEGGLGPWQSFIEGLASEEETATTLVFMDDELTGDNPMLAALKQLQPSPRVQEFRPMKPSDVAGWIVRRAERYGATLEGRAVAALTALVGNQLWTLDSEIQKLEVHASGRAVTEDDVRSLVSLAREPNVFAMVDAVIEGRGRDATELLTRLLAESESPQRLLGVVARQYRLLLLTKELLEQRIRPAEISSRLRVQGFVVQRLLKQAPAYTVERVRRAYRLLLGADLSIKRGVYDDETALHLLIAELAALACATPRDGRPGYSRPPGGPASAPPRAATGSSGRR